MLMMASDGCCGASSFDGLRLAHRVRDTELFAPGRAEQPRQEGSVELASLALYRS
jgi:hypothetical protein